MKINHYNYFKFTIPFSDIKYWKGMTSGQILQVLKDCISERGEVDFGYNMQDIAPFEVKCLPENKEFCEEQINKWINSFAEPLAIKSDFAQ